MPDDSNAQYKPLVSGQHNDHDRNDNSDEEVASPSWNRPSPKRVPSNKQKRRPHRRWLLALAFVCVSLLSAWAGMCVKGFYTSLDKQCAKHTAHWSPVLNDVSIKYGPKLFNGSFMKEDIYRQVGSDEVDAAWEALGVNYRAGVISKKDGLKSGLTEHLVQRADKYGGGFMVNVEGMHHLHCLNLVRQALYFNYDRYRALGHHAFKNEEHILRLHVTHCLDTIRQVLMCNVDTGVLGQVWVDPQSPMAFPDFNTRHVCKNYNEVRKFAEKLQAPVWDDIPPDFLEPPGPDDVMPAIP